MASAEAKAPHRLFQYIFARKFLISNFNLLTMPFVNALTGKKRRRTTNRTSRNRRSLALDAYDCMVVRDLHKRIESLMDLLSVSLVTVSVLMLSWSLNFVDEDIISVITLSWIALMNEINLEIVHLLSLDSQLVDLDPEDELAKGHSCRPRHHCSLEDYGSPEKVYQDTGFSPDEIRTIMEFLEIPEVLRIEVHFILLF